MDSAIPPSTIASLSSGEFVGIVADDPDNKIELKSFYSEIMNNHEALKKEQFNLKELATISNVTGAMINESYLQIKSDINRIIETEIEIIMNTPGMEGLLVKK